MNVHVGWLAGQNISHLHYHLCDYEIGDSRYSTVRQEMLRFFDVHQNLVLQNDTVILGVGGARTAQCFLLPKEELSEKPVSEQLLILASRLARLVSLYNDKFRSKQGIGPDFKIGLFFEKAIFQYGFYIPILNHWGASEEMMLYEHGRARIALLWPHELTSKYLKSNKRTL